MIVKSCIAPRCTSANHPLGLLCRQDAAGVPQEHSSPRAPSDGHGRVLAPSLTCSVLQPRPWQYAHGRAYPPPHGARAAPRPGRAERARSRCVPQHEVNVANVAIATCSLAFTTPLAPCLHMSACGGSCPDACFCCHRTMLRLFVHAQHASVNICTQVFC